MCPLHHNKNLKKKKKEGIILSRQPNESILFLFVWKKPSLSKACGSKKIKPGTLSILRHTIIVQNVET
jgi:hypothetical protein